MKTKDITNSECYRILVIYLDVVKSLCQLYLDLGRYRDYVGHVKEALDISQIHYLKKRVTEYMLHQIESDVIAGCFNETSARMKMVARMVQVEKIESNLESMQTESIRDLFSIRNYIRYTYLNLLKEAKNAETETIELTIFFKSKINLLHRLIKSSKTIKDYCKDIFIDAFLAACGFCIKFIKTTKGNKYIYYFL